MSQYSADPLSACCGDPGDCNQAHLYCFNRTPKEADVEAMHKFEAAQKQDKIETPEQRKAFDVAFDAKRSAAQAAINGATHGSFEGVDKVRAGLAAVDAQIAKLEAQIAEEEDFEADIGTTLLDPLPGKIVRPRPIKDEIKRPDHYARFAIEPCTFIMLNELPYWAGNVVKYVTRAPHKHADERIDIRKAIRYCEMRIEALDREAAGTDGDVIGRPL